MSLVAMAAAFLLERSIERFREHAGFYVQKPKPGDDQGV